MLGIASGACFRLSRDEDVAAGLHLAEDIETALSCMASGFRPMWAALSAGGIARFPVLPGIEALTVLADHDTSGTGVTAARRCAERLQQAGREVRIAWPPIPGKDWADGAGERP
jgi:hypothetical protein